MFISVLDAGTLGDDLDLGPLEEFGRLSIYRSTSREELPSRIAEADIILVNKVLIDKKALSCAPKLKLICVSATGYDNIDLSGCREKGVAVCNVAGYSTDSVAQLTLAVTLWLSCRFGDYLPFVREGHYSASGMANKVWPPFYELRGKTWGIVGYGNIGKQVGSMAAVLGCRLLVNRKNIGQETDVEYADIDTLCRKSDIISLHVPLNNETRGLIDCRRIGLMKPGVIFVNAARGAVTDEKALAQAALDGRLGGLGADVYTEEPFTESHPFYALRGLPNVCLTPHMAWAAYEARKRCLEEVVLNIRAFLTGENRNRVGMKKG